MIEAQTSQSGSGRPFTRLEWWWLNTPALLLGAVRLVTVVQGATLLRGDDHQAALWILGLGVAWLALILEFSVATKLSAPVESTQSWWTLLPCWAVVLFAATSFNALAAFQELQTSVKAREEAASLAAYWHHETGRMRTWLTEVRSATAVAITAKTQAVAAEDAASVAARRAGQPFSSAPLAALRKELAALRKIEADAQKAPLPSAAVPQDAAAAATQLGSAATGLTDVFIKAQGPLPKLAPVPVAGIYNAPPTDHLTLFVKETRAWTPVARVGWLVGFLIELINFVAVWRGGRRTMLADRVRDWKARMASTAQAVRRDRPASEGPGDSRTVMFRLEPMGLAGAITRQFSERMTIAEFLPHLQSAIALEPSLSGSRINRCTTVTGRPLADDRPLFAQLGDGPLVAVMEER